MQSGRLPGLDILRGLAALLVVAFHAEFLTGQAGWFSHGHLAVDFFFALSGFVMARAYEAEMPGPLAFGAMRLRRFAPVMACGSVLGFVALLGEQGWLWAAAFSLLSLLYLPWPASNQVLFPANPPQWSILFELLCNVLHAAIFVRMRSLALIVTMLFLIALVLYGSAEPSDTALALPRTMFSYCMGILLQRHFRRIPRLPFVLAPVILVLLPLLASGMPWLDWLFLLAGIPIALIAGLSGNRQLPLLGQISFPLYAVHYPVLVIAFQAGAGIALGVAAAVAVAFGVMLTVERGRSSLAGAVHR